MSVEHAASSALSAVARPSRILWVSPQPEFRVSTIYIERQIESLLAAGVEGRTFHLRSRTAPGVMFREWRRLRTEVREFQPEVIHAQYGTATAFIAALAARGPLVVTFRGSDLNPNPEKSCLRCFLGRVMSQAAALRATSIICVSEQLVGRLWWGKGK